MTTQQALLWIVHGVSFTGMLCIGPWATDTGSPLQVRQFQARAGADTVWLAAECAAVAGGQHLCDAAEPYARRADAESISRLATTSVWTSAYFSFGICGLATVWAVVCAGYIDRSPSSGRGLVFVRVFLFLETTAAFATALTPFNQEYDAAETIHNVVFRAWMVSRACLCAAAAWSDTGLSRVFRDTCSALLLGGALVLLVHLVLIFLHGDDGRVIVQEYALLVVYACATTVSMYTEPLQQECCEYHPTHQSRTEEPKSASSPINPYTTPVCISFRLHGHTGHTQDPL